MLPPRCCAPVALVDRPVPGGCNHSNWSTALRVGAREMRGRGAGCRYFSDVVRPPQADRWVIGTGRSAMSEEPVMEVRTSSAHSPSTSTAPASVVALRRAQPPAAGPGPGGAGPRSAARGSVPGVRTSVSPAGVTSGMVGRDARPGRVSKRARPRLERLRPGPARRRRRRPGQDHAGRRLGRGRRAARRTRPHRPVPRHRLGSGPGARCSTPYDRSPATCRSRTGPR